MELIYTKEKEKKEDLINKIYLWYIDKLKLYEELKYMKIKSYIGPEEFDDERYVNENIKIYLKKEKNIYYKLKELNKKWSIEVLNHIIK